MDRTQASAVVLTAAGVAGYVLGLFAAYPGRAFSVTLVMVGVTLLSVHPPLPGGAAS